MTVTNDNLKTAKVLNIVSFVLSGIAIFFGALGVLFSIPSLIIAIIAKKKAGKTDLNTAAIIVSIISVSITTCLLIGIVLLFSVISGAADKYEERQRQHMPTEMVK